VEGEGEGGGGDFVFIGEIPPLREARNHGSDRCAQKADPHPLFKGVSQILLCDEFYSGISSLNGLNVCAVHSVMCAIRRKNAIGDNNKPRLDRGGGGE